MLHQETKGSGNNTIVFIHGASQSAEIWGTLINEPLLAGYRSICIDLPGHGLSFRSPEPDKDYTLKGMAIHLKHFLLSLDEDYIIVTSSLAGNIVAEIITELPCCKGLVLTGSSVIGQKISIDQIVKPNPYLEVTFTAHPTCEMMDGLLSTWAESMNESLRSNCMKMFSNTDPAVRTELGAAIARADWSDEIHNLELMGYPIAIVYGLEEKIIYPDYLNKTNIRMWQNGIIKISDAGHCCQLDQPAVLAELISNYATDIFRPTGS